MLVRDVENRYLAREIEDDAALDELLVVIRSPTA